MTIFEDGAMLANQQNYLMDRAERALRPIQFHGATLCPSEITFEPGFGRNKSRIIPAKAKGCRPRKFLTLASSVLET